MQAVDDPFNELAMTLLMRALPWLDNSARDGLRCAAVISGIMKGDRASKDGK